MQPDPYLGKPVTGKKQSERTAHFAQQTKNNLDSRYCLNRSIMGTEPVS